MLRPIKLLLTGQLIDRLDAVLQQGLGGFRTRHSLVEEAIEYYLQELQESERDYSSLELASPNRIIEAPVSAEIQQKLRSAEKATVPAQPPVDRPNPPSFVSLEKNPHWKELLKEPRSIEETSVLCSSAKATVSSSQSLSRPDRVPLLGLHNRDWPTLKALELLNQMSASGSVPCSDFYNVATASGWKLSDFLQKYQSAETGKLSALLPSNREKSKAAENNYRNFALGWIEQSETGKEVRTSGPIFSWSAAGLIWQKGELHIGLTESGVSLLEGISGISPIAPHPEDKAQFFLSHIAEFGPSDWNFFREVLIELLSTPTRNVLITSITNSQKSSNSVAASLAQGYIARGREWGLIEQKQRNGHYLLTQFGKEIASSPS